MSAQAEDGLHTSLTDSVALAALKAKALQWTPWVPKWNLVRAVITVTGALVILLGASVCVGWWLESENLVRFTTDSGVTTFNAALIFILLGIGELAIVANHRTTAKTVAGLALIISILTFVEHVAGVNLRIDTVFAGPFEIDGQQTPTRMSSAAALVLAILSIMLALRTAWATAAPWLITLMVVLMAAVGGITMIAVISYLGRTAMPESTTSLTASALHTVIALTLLVGSRVYVLWKEEVAGRPDLPKWFLPSLILGFITVFLSMFSVMSLNNQLRTETATLSPDQSFRLNVALIVVFGFFMLIVVPTINLVRRKGKMALEKAQELYLEVELRKRTEKSLEHYNAELRRSNRDLEEFAYIASHDLKAPMRGIDNTAKWLEEDLEDVLTDDTRETLRLMRSRIKRMESLLDDLLTYSRAGRTDTAIDTVDVNEMVERLADLLSPPDSIMVRTEGRLPTLRTAHGQLEQILRNLINNAIKHHDKPAGEVVISARQSGDFYEFSVRDDGPGIPAEFREKIFKLFQTLKRRDEVEGTGMGLAVVKKLVERQGGTIEVRSDGPGKGAEFRFMWPVTIKEDYEGEQ